MLRDRILTIITVIFSMICVAWFFCLIMDSRERANMLDDSSELRQSRACQKSTANIKIGVVLNNNEDDARQLQEALKLAEQKINIDGLLGGRKLELVFRNDNGDINKAREIAQSFADDLDISLVIGHMDSGTTINVLPIYEFYGILLFSPSASSPRLTNSGAQLFYRNTLNDHDLAASMSEFCREKKLDRVVVLFPDSVYGRGMANSLESQASLYNVDVVDRKTFSPDDPQFEKILMDWKLLYKYTAVIGIFTSIDNCRSFLAKSYAADMKQPVMLAPDMSGVERYAKAEILWPTVYIFDTRPQNPLLKSGQTKDFYQNFLQKTGQKPTYIAYNGYDALLALTEAIAEAGCPSSSKVAEFLHRKNKFAGVSGAVKFEKNGDPVRDVTVLKISSGKVQPANRVSGK